MSDSSSQFRDYYRDLGVSPDASGAEIREAWLKEAERWDPESNPSRESAEMMRRIDEARDVLLDARRRAEYDRTYQQERADDAQLERERQARMQREAREQTRREAREARDQWRRRTSPENARSRSGRATASQHGSDDSRQERERQSRMQREARQQSRRDAQRQDANPTRREHANRQQSQAGGSRSGGVGIGVWLAIGAVLLIPIVVIVGLLVLNLRNDSTLPERPFVPVVAVSPTATSTPRPTSTPVPTQLPRQAAPAATAVPTPPPTATTVPTPVPLPTATPNPPTSTPVPTATPFPTATVAPAPTATATPVPVVEPTPTAAVSQDPTATPVVIWDGSPTALHVFLLQVGVTTHQVQLMIQAGAPVNATDADGRDALEVAAERGLGADILTVLIENGADPSRSPTILHALLRSHNVQTRQVRTLVDAGASVVAEDARGIAPLEVAVAEGLSASMLRYLVLNGADVTHSPTILHSLLASDAVTAEHVEALVNAGASETSTDAYGQTPLDIAIENGLGREILDLLR